MRHKPGPGAKLYKIYQLAKQTVSLKINCKYFEIIRSQVATQ